MAKGEEGVGGKTADRPRYLFYLIAPDIKGKAFAIPAGGWLGTVANGGPTDLLPDDLMFGPCSMDQPHSTTTN